MSSWVAAYHSEPRTATPERHGNRVRFFKNRGSGAPSLSPAPLPLGWGSRRRGDGDTWRLFSVATLIEVAALIGCCTVLSMRKELTTRQQVILGFLREFVDSYQRPPTHREICARFSFKSTNAAADHLQKLEKWGWIERDHNLARGIRFTEESEVLPRQGLERGHFS